MLSLAPSARVGALAAVLTLVACGAGAAAEDDAPATGAEPTAGAGAAGTTISAAGVGASTVGGGVAHGAGAASGGDAGAGDAGAGDAGATGTPPSGASTPPSGTPSGGCGKSGAPKGVLSGQKITVGGAARSYDVFVGAAHDGKTPLPLVFVFSGAGGTGAQVRASYPIEGQAGGKAIFVYPNARTGSGAPPNNWDLDSVAAKNQDILLFDALRAQVATTWCVDTKRVFAAGVSAGAYFANQLGCRRGAELRATAAHSGGGPFGNDDEYGDDGNLVCPEAPAGGALVIHGLADGTVAPSEGAASLAYWRAADRCAAGNGASWGPSPCLALACAAGHPVVHCEVPGLGHTVWAHGAEATWKFFAQF